MFEIRRNTTASACLLLLMLLGVAAFSETPSAAKLRHSPASPNVRNSSPDNTTVQNTDDVQITIATFQGGQVYEQTVSGVRSANLLETRTNLNAPAQTTAAGDIVFSQIYSRGGSPGSTYQNNYLEILNRTNNTVDISGWRFYVGDSTNGFSQAISFVSSRGIGVGAGRYILIQFGPASSNGAPLPTPDFVAPFHVDPPPGFPPIPDLNLFPSGKVALTTTGVDLFGSACPLPNAGIVDFVGYGTTTTCFEGGGPVSTLSLTTAAVRKTNGCTDTDNNNSDFDVSSPAPRNSSSTPNFCNPAPPQIQFSQASFNGPENGGGIALLVTRTGNTAAASTVDYTTSDTSGANNCNVINGNASSRCDYIAAVGTLKFAANETFKLLNILWIDDTYAEGSENFSATLSNPTAATLGTQSTTSVVINDNENTNGVNPVDTSSFFVRQHYLDFLNREPDTAGNNFWIGEIENCTLKPQCTEIKRINVSAAFFLSIEFQETGYLAYRAYKAAYGDATGTAILQGTPTQIPVPMIRLQEFLADSHAIGEGFVCCSTQAQQQLEANKVAYFNAFVLRQRFLTDYPLTMNAGEFVDKLNLRAGNVLSAQERDNLVNQLQTAQKTRAEVVRAVAEDSDLNNAEKNRAFVLMQFFGYLRRNPNDPQDTDYTGYKFWLDKLNQFSGNFVDAEMVKAFITSGEYRQRFGP
ncbi:MAG TPA: Calx-beta domain-containing protein [Pyrinomonadaceae bacterium]|nr:Calx-beta domain-containing protein [Pyrinomonadaceae bacterium]